MIWVVINGVLEMFLLPKFISNLKQAMDGLNHGSNDLIYLTEVEQVKNFL